MDKKINILFIELCLIGGPPNRLLDLIEVINQKYSDTYKCIVIGAEHSILDGKSNFTFYKTRAIGDEHTHKNLFEHLMIYLKIVYLIFTVSLKHNVDIMYCNHYQPSIYANPIGLLLNIPVVIHLRDIWQLEPKIARILMKCNPFSRYIAISNYVKEVFDKKYKVNRKKITTIYDGINITQQNASSYPEKKQVNPKKIILMVSRLEEERNIEIFVDVAAIITNKYSNIRFIHCGIHEKSVNKKYFAQLIQKTKELNLQEDQFTFLPYITEKEKLNDLFKASYLSLVTAQDFALPNVAIESMLNGTPVIAYTTGGNKEVVINQSVGSLVKFNTAAFYMMAIESFLKDKNKYITASKLGREYVQKKFNGMLQNKKIIDFINTMTRE